MKSTCWNETNPTCILFLLQLNHTDGGFKAISGSQSLWKCVHIDELRAPSQMLPSLIKYKGKSVSSMFDYDAMQKDNNLLLEVTELVKGCLQSAMKELNETKTMSSDDISSKINTLVQLLTVHVGKVIFHSLLKNVANIQV